MNSVRRALSNFEPCITILKKKRTLKFRKIDFTLKNSKFKNLNNFFPTAKGGLCPKLNIITSMTVLWQAEKQERYQENKQTSKYKRPSSHLTQTVEL